MSKQPQKCGYCGEDECDDVHYKGIGDPLDEYVGNLQFADIISQQLIDI